MSAKVISFLNFKGGVGKTSNTVNLAACLAFHHRKRVLIIDLDAQCNSSYWLVRPSEFRRRILKNGGDGSIYSSCQIYRDALQKTSLFEFEKSVIRGVPHGEEGFELIPRLDLLPGNIHLLELEFSQNTPETLVSLRQTLRPLLNRYDYILLDCPPNIYRVSQTALMASDHVVVPYNPDYLSLSGFRILSHQLSHLNTYFRTVTDDAGSPQVAALIINRFQKVGEAYTTAIAELESQMDQLRETGHIHSRCLILDPAIRQDVKIAECTSEHKPVILHDPHCNGSHDYLQLAESFVKHFEEIIQ